MGNTIYDIKPGTFKYIESEIYNLNENKKEIKNEREQLQFCLKHYNFVNKKSWYYSNINFSFLTGIA
ncbi:hypothetical protein ACFKKD_00565, partial [Streptococcus agalactiae]